MGIPATQFDVAVFLVMVLPGIVYAAVRTHFAGLRGHDRNIADRILQALLVSVLLDMAYAVVYLLLRGDRAVEVITDPRAWTIQHLRQVAVGLLILGVSVPGGLAFLVYGPLAWKPVVRHRRLRWLKRPAKGHTTYQPTPTAWDYAAPRQGGRWVRIRIGEGAWVGGWIGEKSYVSTYPEPRDMFIEDQHHVNALGEIEDRVENSAGFWISLPEGAIVEWIDP